MQKKYWRFIIGFIVLALGGGAVVMLSIATNKHRAFERQNETTAAYSATSLSRVSNAVITLPGSDQIVGLQNGNRDYTPDHTTTKGMVNLLSNYLLTQFVAGVYQKTAPRLDAIAPVYVSQDPYGGSMYVVLFWDRGDAAIERSYVRLGGADVHIGKITTSSPRFGTKEEYQVVITYTLEGRDQKTNQLVVIPKEAIVPVIDGHFDPQGTLTK